MGQNSDTKSQAESLEETLGVRRGQAADVIGGHVSTVRRLEKRGELPFTIDEKGHHRFKMSDLEAIRDSRSTAPDEETSDNLVSGEDVDAENPSGALYAALFSDLEAGKSLVEMVCRNKVPPELVRAVVSEWRELKELDINAPSVAREIAVMDRHLSKLDDRISLVESELEDLTDEDH